MLLSTAYFPPAAYFALLARDFTLSPDRVLPSTVWLEACENYQKQSYRNRCYILAGDGVQKLQVPVIHDGNLEITRIKVDYSTPWVVRTERAIDAAYFTSAWFEYYRNDLFALLDAHPETLWDLNLSIIRFFLERTGIACDLQPTTDFEPPATVADDWRYTLHPKRPDAILTDLGLDRPYFQVFAGRFGFTPGLSVMDLLFNEGPDALRWLKKL